MTTQSPNIVLVILEGWSGDIVKSCGGYDSISPNMEYLIKQGVFFNHCYASGFRSEQGMAAIFSAFPAQPKTSIIKQPNKYVHLPCINTELKQKGYTTSFCLVGSSIMEILKPICILIISIKFWREKILIAVFHKAD